MSRTIEIDDTAINIDDKHLKIKQQLGVIYRKYGLTCNRYFIIGNLTPAKLECMYHEFIGISLGLNDENTVLEIGLQFFKDSSIQLNVCGHKFSNESFDADVIIMCIDSYKNYYVYTDDNMEIYIHKSKHTNEFLLVFDIKN